MPKVEMSSQKGLKATILFFLFFFFVFFPSLGIVDAKNHRIEIKADSGC